MGVLVGQYLGAQKLQERSQSALFGALYQESLANRKKGGFRDLSEGAREGGLMLWRG